MKKYEELLKIPVIKKRPGVSCILETSESLAFPTTNCETSHFHEQIHSPGDIVIYLETCAQKTLLHVHVSHLTAHWCPIPEEAPWSCKCPEIQLIGDRTCPPQYSSQPTFSTWMCSEMNWEIRLCIADSEFKLETSPLWFSVLPFFAALEASVSLVSWFLLPPFTSFRWPREQPPQAYL